MLVMYKDKDKQREANRIASKRRRMLAKRESEGMTTTLENVIPIIPSSDIRVIPKRGKDIKCFEDLSADVLRGSGGIDYKPGCAVNCISVVTGKPGDADYNGICTEAWRVERGR